MSYAGSSIGLADKCFHCYRPGVNGNLFLFTCPACPGPRISNLVGVTRVALCQECLITRACFYCGRRPATDDYQPFYTETSTEESSGGTGGCPDQASLLQRYQAFQRHEKTLQKRMNVMAAELKHLWIQEAAREIPKRRAMQDFVKVRLTWPDGRQRNMWVQKTATVSAALTQAAVNSTWVATCDDAELVDDTIIGDIIGSSPSETIECTMKPKNSFFSQRSTCWPFLYVFYSRFSCCS